MGEQIARFRSSDRYDDSSFVNKKVGTTFKILSNVNPRLFHDVIQIVRQYLYSGDTVDSHDDYSKAKCYLSSDGLSGFAIEPVGNLISWSRPQVHNRIALQIVSPPMSLWITLPFGVILVGRLHFILTAFEVGPN